MNDILKTTSLIVSFILFGLLDVFGQEAIKIEEAGILFQTPSNKWSYGGNEYKDSISIHYFDREGIPYKYRNYKQSISASITFSVEPIGELDPVTFSAQKRIENPFEVLELFLPKDLGMSLENGVGYKSTYADYIGVHTIYVLHMVNKGLGITIICDISDDLFEQIKPEFLSVLKSIETIN